MNKMIYNIKNYEKFDKKIDWFIYYISLNN